MKWSIKKKKKEKERYRMTASILKQDPNTKRFKRMLTYYDTDRHYANFVGKSLHQATKQHLNNS